MSVKLFDFQNEFKLGIDDIDSEHEKLVNMLNEVHALLSAGERDKARAYFNETLSLYVNEHFAHEEAFMAAIGYAQLDEHKKIHENFKASFEALKPDIALADDTAFRSALMDTFTWIINHIGRTDKKYAKFYIGK